MQILPSLVKDENNQSLDTFLGDDNQVHMVKPDSQEEVCVISYEDYQILSQWLSI